MHGNFIKVTIDVDIKGNYPYYLRFKYVGDVKFKERLLAVSYSGDYILNVELMVFNWILVSFNKDNIRHYYKPNLNDLFEGKISNSMYFKNKKHVEIARRKAEKELNEFLAREWKIYNDLYSYKESLEERFYEL